MTEFRPLPTDRRPRIAVLDDYMGVAHKLASWEKIEARADVDFLHEPIGKGEAGIEQLREYDAICLLRERTAFSGELLSQLPNLKAIAATGLRNRTLDHGRARELGIAVMTTTGSGSGVYATAELAWGLILGLMRFIPEESAAMRQGAWQTRLGNALWGKTIGIVGLGKLGARMAHIAKAFGMEAVAWSPNLTPERAAEAGATYLGKQELLATADVVSLHLVLGPTTRGIIGGQDLTQMKPDSILINTARGPLVDEQALLDALRNGQIRGAGIDVYDQEPLPADHPIRTLPNALVTPHLGYSVRETFEAFYRQTVENLESWLDGQPIRLAEQQ
ncbi:D-isomer specific 2-hydroxyacid dehydrogenase; 3-phosphoglycerate dehydrogenase (PGDH/SerA)-like, glyoxylate reductase (GyaR)-like; NAD-binding [Pseudorhizobium banfieldiae]|uniref:D-isomer specific 2-hydroxyacid dehydrogenase 3-phosphoglycerate dehydrogenase (PGDH/SerA)-like, glyoxylate reductase (GyaR)-like NAD-binding n=1 Tax=Pseudorhizobium banfieldiae TaxID=1125847 RepID=L0NA88_9HYPH|nr:D-2-hydroxyacid dehydrogenase family protein [Pseudorhizobium banfieldiae]CAD6598542.1 2-hydroxyacid dehydrogenase [arsenite-oxidising bacterium NT-25]CCF17900.1 D-isomer specific 2-hydroxyacid dehydrogenase; 3-phosphoglycerate dehydrogenase (PGDH/SerA)-like, glyoxylate reductase (GyaR)-like; NAD-binding [Pseudorhizobium banfieldiae]